MFHAAILPPDKAEEGVEAGCFSAERNRVKLKHQTNEVGLNSRVSASNKFRIGQPTFWRPEANTPR
jgi:hypothetical protein